MKITPDNLFRWTSPVNRYNYLPQLFSRNQSVLSQGTSFPGFPDNNNYSYFTTEKVADDFADLGKAAKVLNLSETGNIFEKAAASAVSSNNNAVSAKTGNKVAQSSYNLQVNQVAKAQENAGKWLNAQDQGLAVDGKQTLSISRVDSKGIPVKSVAIDVQTKTGQTNQGVLNRTAEAINLKSQILGVQARVETRNFNGVEQARLVVTGTQTGINAGTFAIKDTTGSLTANAAINNVTTTAQNAKYILNGLTQESQSNEINLDRAGQVKATIKNTTPLGQTVKITVKPQDATAIYSKTKEFIDQYNQALRDLRNPVNRPTADMNQNFGITQIGSAERNKLATMGINVNNDHTLSVNENRFRASLVYEPDKVREVLGGAGGFAVQIGDKAENVDLANHLKPDTDGNFMNNYYPGKFFNYYL